MPLSFVTCVSNREVLNANLLAAPCLGPSGVYEFITFSECVSAADGLNAGFPAARHEWLVFVHQDVFLPYGWDLHFP
jgi:Glycosyltransferase like family